MAKFTDHFSGTVRTTKDDLRFGPLKVRRVEAVPADTFGRNGDLVIVDDTSDSSPDIAIRRIPTETQLCQKVPIAVTAGDFTITTASGVFTITISSLDDFVDEVRRAEIPGLTLEHQPTGSVTINTVSSTWSDGTSNLPSALGIAGAQAGTFTVAVGTWECVRFGGVAVLDDGTLIGNFTDLNFAGAGISSIVDDGGGQVTITISGGGGGDAYDTITGDTGSASASGSSTLNVIGIAGGIIETTAADGSPDSLTLETVNDMEWSSINGQQVLTFEDPTRAGKRLSVTDHPIMFSDNDLDDQEWLEIGDASNADVGYVADLDGTVVMATGQCEDANGNSKEIHLYINGTDEGSVGTLSGGSNVQFVNTTLNVDFSQGDKIRLRAENGSGSDIEDTVVKLTLKWRA